MPVLPSHAGIMPVIKRNLIIIGFLVKFASSEIRILRIEI